MKHILFLFSIAFLTVSFGQSKYQFSGTVLDSTKNPIDLAIVSLFSFSDSILIKSEFTDKEGRYIFSNVKEGKYIFQIKNFGYAEFKDVIEINETKELPPIQLVESNKSLNQVTVQANIPFAVRKIDRTVVTPDALISSAGTNALEVLEQAPGVSVNNDGGIVLKGRSGVSVFINDKPSYLSGTELENYLKSLPASSIKNIEIIENPPAKYEAAGNVGIININLKRNTVKGIYGNMAVSYRRSRYNGSNNSLNLNYNKNKISIYSNFYGGFWENFQDLNINRYYLDQDDVLQSSFSQNSYNNRGGMYLNGRVGLDFYATEKTTIGAGFKRSISPGKKDTDNTSLVSDASGALMQRVVADNLSETRFDNNLVNIYLTHRLDTLGSKISFDADYVQYVSTNDQTFGNFLYDPSDVLISENEINGEIPSEINIFAVKTDYTKPFKDESRFEAGLKSAYTKTDNEAIYTNTVDGITTPDYDLSNRFLYDEWINSAYINYNRSIGKVQLQLGLRGEQTHLEGTQLGNELTSDTSFTRDYGSLFPTFYAARSLDSAGVHNLNLSYGRRIERPYFQDLNPFISPLDKFTYYTGNPNLLPTYAHNLGLTYSFKNKINTTLSYAKTVNGINETLEIRDGIYYSRPGNISSSEHLTLAVDGSFSITKWYTINAYAEVSEVRFDSKLYTEQLNSRGTNVYASATNSFRFKKGWRADISGRYMNDRVYSQLLLKGYAVLNFGVQKTILDGKGSLKLSVNDLLYTQKGDGIINNLKQTDADWNSKYDSRSVRIAFSWRFGKSTSTKEKYNGSGSDSEQRRVKG